MNNYKPRPSVYTRTAFALRDKQNIKGSPLTKEEAIRCIKATPGLMFSAGWNEDDEVVLDRVFETLKVWRLIKIDGDLINANGI